MGKINNIEIAKQALKIEANSILSMMSKIDDSFDKVINLILSCEGRAIITGMGKSGIIAQKIASTLSSTGSPSYFMHPGDAIHGDLGMIKDNDIVIAISNSGETLEINHIIKPIKKRKIPLIALVGSIPSTLSLKANIYLDISVDKEACSLNLAPTSSTTTTLAMGDAIAIALLENKNFTKKDFALFHPGGSIGKQLLLKIDQLIHKDDKIPYVYKNSTIKDSLFMISEKGLGLTGVLNDKTELIGIITDGDIRRGLSTNGNQFLDDSAAAIMNKSPKRINSNSLALEALKKMEKYNITSLFVFSNEDDKKPIGVIHIHDIIKSGIG